MSSRIYAWWYFTIALGFVLLAINKALTRRLREESFQAALLLQVHDALAFEAPPEETQKLSAMVKQEMEQVYPLQVPLVADIGVGEN